MVVAVERTNGYLTSDEAAELLHVRRETVYRYTRRGKLHATRSGRRYRIAARELSALPARRRSSSPIPLHAYSDDQIAAFLRDDAMDLETAAIAERFAMHARV